MVQTKYGDRPGHDLSEFGNLFIPNHNGFRVTPVFLKNVRPLTLNQFFAHPVHNCFLINEMFAFRHCLKVVATFCIQIFFIGVTIWLKINEQFRSLTKIIFLI